MISGGKNRSSNLIIWMNLRKRKKVCTYISREKEIKAHFSNNMNSNEKVHYLN